MKKEYFTDNLSIEDIAEMTDKMLRFEHKQKTGKKKANLLKLIPAAAAALFAVWLVNNTNIISVINFGGNGNYESLGAAAVTAEERSTSHSVAEDMPPVEDVTVETIEQSDETVTARMAERLKEYEEWTEEWERFLRKAEENRDTWGNMANLEYWDKMPWIEFRFDSPLRMFKLKDGTEIETGSFLTKQDWYGIDLAEVAQTPHSNFMPVPVELYESVLEHLKSVILPSFEARNNIKPSELPGNYMGLMLTYCEGTVRLANGVTLEIPAGTLLTVKFANADPEMEITVGIGSAKITRPDGTEQTVPAGTIIGGEGNIIG